MGAGRFRGVCGHFGGFRIVDGEIIEQESPVSIVDWLGLA